MQPPALLPLREVGGLVGGWVGWLAGGGVGVVLMTGRGKSGMVPTPAGQGGLGGVGG